ncbi:glutamate-1-semialdehyde 2,1-aminomutase [Bythopirellula polymerisocia]|uniref:Glutamate-1-semialdehyde 2,1-aminomutase n=1 Tax=Bythopirellula polymerisocia TaxID=2528003 RepID=A0A5C6C9J2_9BACT|nr:glutamate-1-semialdehyde 2,1-aminomutase [Bythopirellula polymerisocia]TWU21260.1 Glutamate-1-semialdehyde 2,1-aminomutase [Bythopirellula polymerisocia]
MALADSLSRRPRSHAAFERAQQLMPGGVNSPARAFGAVGGTPIFIERAEGAYLYDIDGDRYVDYIGSWGPMILGHRHPAVVAALEAALSRGTSYGAPTEAESELAERIIDAVASIEKVRLVSSGTEATMSAVRLARGFTGRDVIIKFAGNYHGHVDSLLVAAGSSAATLGTPNSPGVTVGTTKDTLVLDYNDVQSLEDAFARHGDKIAGVILEPVVGNMGVVVPSQAFVSALNRLTKSHGALLICDEVMTGFRVAFGGAQQLLGLEPDITTLGKIVGGGLPVGAYGGRAEVMNHILPAGKVFQAGTLSGNPLATAAGNATLKILKEQPPYDRLEHLTARLEAGLHAAAEKAGIIHTIARVGSMVTLFFSGEGITSWQAASRCNTEQFARFFWGMMNRGVYLPCSQYEALFISAAHTEDDIDRTIAASEEVMQEMST